MGSVRSEDPINRQRQTARRGPASALTATQARLLVRHNHGGPRPEPAACVAWVLKLLYTLTSENAQQLLAGGHCIRATLFGKVDDLQFAPLRGHNLDPKN